MDAKQFLAEFGHIANAPGGVQKLRELTLSLAFQGKLIEQEVNDKPASHYIELNNRKKKQLVNEKKLRKKHDPRPVNESEKPWDIPEKWQWTRLGKVTNYGDSQKATYDDVDSSIWVLELEDIEKLTSKLLKRVRAKDRKFKSTKSIFVKGAVLYGKLRPYLDKVIVADESGVCTTEIIPISFFEGVDASYMRWYLKCPYFVNYANNSTHGMNLPRMGTESARLAPFPFAPLAEQARIVAKVDELMVLCDELEEQQQQKRKLQNQLRQATLQAVAAATSHFELKQHWQRLQDNFEQLFSAPEDVKELRDLVLSLAVKGLLVLQDINEEPISIWLDDVSVKKKELLSDKKIGKQTAFTRLSVDDYPFKLPRGWAFSRLGEFTNKIGSGSTPRGGAKAYVNDGIPFFRSQNIWNDGLKLSGVAFISGDTHEKMKNTAVFSSDLLLNITGASLGRCTLVPEDFGEGNVSQHVSIIRLTEPSVREYLHLCILSPYTQSMIWGRQVGMAREGLSKKVLEQFEIPLPPLKEQDRIVRRVTELMAQCDSLEEKLARGIKLAEQLALASTATLTGINTPQEKESLKVPKTELVAPVILGQNKPTNKDSAPLAALLERQNGQLNASDLWQRFGGEIEAFYAQLKTEVSHGWIAEPAKAKMLEKDAS